MMRVKRRMVRLATAAAAWLMLLGSVAPTIDAWQHALEQTPGVGHCVICSSGRAPEPPADAARVLPLPVVQREHAAAPAVAGAVTFPEDRSPPSTRAPPA